MEDRLRPWLRPILIVGLLSTTFLLATFLVVEYQVAAYTDTDSSRPFLEDDAAQAVLAWALGLTVPALVALWWIARPDQRAAAARASILMTALGGAGYLSVTILTPHWALLDLLVDGAGPALLGLVPGWELWTYLILAAPLVNLASRWPGKPWWWGACSWWLALYLVGNVLWWLQYRLQERGGGGHAPFGLAFASVVVTLAYAGRPVARLVRG